MISADFKHKFWVSLVVFLPLGAVFFAMYYAWNRYLFAEDLVLMGVLYFFTAMGIGVGYHRLLTHTGFKTYAPIKAFFLICGAMAYEGAPFSWTATHIKHHAHSDEEHDPHSPLDGFWHAHLGWLFEPMNFPEVQQYAPHLLDDPVAKFVEKYTLVWMGLALAIPFLIGGWTGLIWAGGVRIFLTTHVTWSVNSICHTFGKRDFETTDESRNQWLVGLLALGEGWHNNHHAFPTSAYHGLKWWQIDINAMMIRTLKALGLAWDVQTVSKEAQEAQRVRALTMQEKLTELREQLTEKIDYAKEELARVADEQHIARDEAFRSAQKRINRIHSFVAGKTHMKKQLLQKYLQEVEEIVQNVKGRMSKVPA